MASEQGANTIKSIMWSLIGGGSLISFFVGYGSISNQLDSNTAAINKLSKVGEDVTAIRTKLEVWSQIGQPTVNSINKRVDKLEIAYSDLKDWQIENEQDKAVKFNIKKP